MEYCKEVKEVLDVLRKYKDLDWVIAGLRKEYDRLSFKGSPRDISAVDFQAVHGGNSGADAIVVFVEMKKIDDRIKDLLVLQERVENALAKLRTHNEVSYKYIQARYIDGLILEDVAEEIGYSCNSKHSMKSIKDKALRDFMFYYCGKI